MLFSEDLVTELSEIKKDDVYTPELFAWKLLLEDANASVLSANLQSFTDTYDEADDPTTFSFEVLLTIFMELIFGMLKLNHYAENQDDQFNPNFSNHNLEDIIPLLKHKFNELCYILSIEIIDETQENNSYVNMVNKNRYCKILLRHNQADSGYFIVNEHIIDPDKDYHMVLNSRYELTDKLNDVYATCSLNDKTYKFSFDKVPLSAQPIYAQ